MRVPAVRHWSLRTGRRGEGGTVVARPSLAHLLMTYRRPGHWARRRAGCSSQHQTCQRTRRLPQQPSAVQAGIWSRRYRVRREMVPAHVSRALVDAIRLAGRSVRFLCDACDDGMWVHMHHAPAVALNEVVTDSLFRGALKGAGGGGGGGEHRRRALLGCSTGCSPAAPSRRRPCVSGRCLCLARPGRARRCCTSGSPRTRSSLSRPTRSRLSTRAPS